MKAFQLVTTLWKESLSKDGMYSWEASIYWYLAITDMMLSLEKGQKVHAYTFNFKTSIQLKAENLELGSFIIRSNDD